MGKQLPFSNRVRELRAESNAMTQSDLAALVGVTRQTIAAIEQGRYSPSLESAFRIARAFSVPLEDVFQWHDP
ncbi:MAG: helix-turn-helix transcriptional regulator [Myxococcota bacterium]